MKGLPDDGSGYTSVEELRKWLSQFAEKNQKHFRNGMVVKKAPGDAGAKSDPTEDLSLSYELQRSNQTLHESKSVSSASTHSTSVASPPAPLRKVNRLGFDPTDLAQGTGRPPVSPSPRSFVVATAEERSSHQQPAMAADPASVDSLLSGKDASVKWYASETNENERIRILAKVDPPARPLKASTFIDAVAINDKNLPSHLEHEDKPPPAHRAIREKIPLLFCKSRREVKEVMDPPSGLTTTVMAPEQTMSRHSQQLLDGNTRPQENATISEDPDDNSFQFDDYWNDASSESNRHRLRQASPSIQQVSTSLVHVFEKEIRFDSSERHPLPAWFDSDDMAGFSHLKSHSYSRESVYDSPSKNESYDTASSSISSKYSELKIVTPPRNEISDKIERFGGRVKAKKLSSIQERMAELENKWAKHKQAEQSKAVKWEAKNGSYKRRVYLQTKGP